MLRLIIVAYLIHISSTTAFSDDPYDDDPLLYVDAHTSKYRTQKPFHNKDDHRGLIDNNYFRLSRSKSENLMPYMEDLESEYEDANDQFARPTRSQDKNDNFVRFGRGNSDFIRFGRDPYHNQNFLRFGRSTSDSNSAKARNKRDAQELEGKRATTGDNFLRFGKSGDDSFIRYGRNPDGVFLPMPTQSHPSFSSNMIREQPYNPYRADGRSLYNSPLLTILRKLEEEMKQQN